MTRILIADDHDLFVEGLKEILARRSDVEFVGQAHDGIQAVEQVSLLKPDVVLMDIAMPRMSGIKASKQISANFPEVKVLILSMHNTRELITESIKAGAKGYILKECSSEELFYSIDSVAAGHYYITHSSLTILLDDYMRLLEEERKSSSCQLSEREIEVLHLMADGKNTKEIASDLMISKNTVDVHRRHIMEKTGCNSMASLIRYAIREGY